MKPLTLCEGLGFAEAPRWRDGRLFFSDMAAREVMTVTLDGEVETLCKFRDQPSGLGFLPGGDLLVVAMHSRRLLRRHEGELSIHADLSELVSADLNDMVVDAHGRAYVTNFGYDSVTEQPKTTGVTVVHPDGAIDTPIGELFRPNGCAITADGQTLIVAETRVHRIAAFSIDPQGHLSGQREIGALPSGTWADGLCVDAEGAVWAADPKGCHCYRMTATGTISHTIGTAPMQAVACALGGPGRRTLFITLGEIRPFKEMAADRRGRIDIVEVEVPGAGWP